MRLLAAPLLLLAFALLAFAGVAHGAPVRMAVHDVPLHGGVRSLAAAPARFNMVGIHWQGSGVPWFRIRTAAGRWSAWEAADDDWGRSGVWRRSNPVWTGVSDAIQFRLSGSVTKLRDYLLWSPPVTTPERHIQIAGSPVIVSRAGWQADEEIRRAPPRYAPTLKLALVHHTVTSNGYSCAQSASIVRGIEVYHVKANGWDDIGYNFLVDACGQIFEGRYGGIDKNVIGAHSQGFNAGTVGVALIGTYTHGAPSQAAQNALVKLLAWRLDLAHIDPLSTVPYVSGGNSKFPAGKTVNLRAISGHRDTYLTECPGDGVYQLLPAIAKRVAASGAPKIYSPLVSGTVGGPVRFTARLSSATPWTVTVADVTGAVVATRSDVGKTVDWTWNSRLAIPGATYRWTISATNARPATGVLSGTLTALTLSKLQVSQPLLGGSVLPNATVSYTLSVPATVTADVLDSTGVSVAPIFTATVAAGPGAFQFMPGNLVDGNYTIRVAARDALGRHATVTAPVTISRSLASFSADSKVVSPNGDGRHDTANFRFTLVQPALVTLSLVDGEEAIPFYTGELTPGKQSIVFTGTALDGTTVPDGVYSATITVGAATQSLPLTIDTTPPTVSLVSLSPLTLSVSEQASVTVTVNGSVIKASRPAGTFTLAKGVKVKTLTVVARDAAGNDSAPLTYPQRR
jgi:N-acetylmuramoyl-L-alanine amidase-like protein